jgi:hypothetical protein
MTRKQIKAVQRHIRELEKDRDESLEHIRQQLGDPIFHAVKRLALGVAMCEVRLKELQDQLRPEDSGGPQQDQSDDAEGSARARRPRILTRPKGDQ